MKHGKLHTYRTHKCRCVPCARANKKHNRDYKAKIKARNQSLVDEAKAGGCEWCGYSLHPYALDLDHVDGEKVAAVSVLASQTYAEETVRNEIAKCRVLCANCHRLATRLGEEEGYNLVKGTLQHT